MKALPSDWAANWLTGAVEVSLVLLALTLLIGLWRAARGPHQSDRHAALKLVWLSSIGFMAVMTLATRNWRILDIALALSLAGGIVPLASAWAARRNRNVRFDALEPELQGDSDVADH